jgi:dipeptidase E
LGIFPFNINPHYLDADPDSTHMGETRETRLKEYLVFNSIPVLGIREGGWVRYDKERIFLKGNIASRWFEPQQDPKELSPESLLYEQGNKMF